MNFGEQIRNIRINNKMTQEEFSEKLGVSRQAVSNWENNRNLPDIEILINIAKLFHISLDELILGGNSNMSEKLIRDGKENKRSKYNLISVSIGALLLIIGLVLIVIKALSVEYIDDSGILHENFFLLPIAFAFIFSGIIAVLQMVIRNIIGIIKKD